MRSIRWRLVFSFMLVTLLTVTVVGSVSYRIIENYLQQREVDSLRANAKAVAKQVYPLLWPVVQYDRLSKLAQTASILGDFRVRIFDKQDRLIVDTGSPSLSEGLMLVVPFINQDALAVSPGDFPVFLWNQRWGELIQKFNIPKIEGLPPGASITVLERSGDPWSGGYILKDWTTSEEMHLDLVDELDGIARSTTSFDFSIGDLDFPEGHVELSALPDYGSDVLLQVRQALLFGGGGGVLLAGLVGFWISHRLASPLKDLANSAAKMGAGDLAVRADVKSGGEIGELARQFNYMAGGLETSFQQLAAERDKLRRFISDASHELRTPITALKNFNTLLKGDAGQDARTRADFLGESQVQIDRLTWITSNLLDLTRLDAGLLDFECADHDLREVISSIAGTFKPMAEEKSIHMSVASPDSPCMLFCDRSRLEMALSNLLDNAIKFTPENGEIEIGVKTENGIQIWVQDNGTGIPPQDLPHVFERFFRGRGYATSGSGLGLAIVRSIIEAQGGQVGIESVLGEGTTVWLSW